MGRPIEPQSQILGPAVKGYAEYQKGEYICSVRTFTYPMASGDRQVNVTFRWYGKGQFTSEMG